MGLINMKLYTSRMMKRANPDCAYVVSIAILMYKCYAVYKSRYIAATFTIYTLSFLKHNG